MPISQTDQLFSLIKSLSKAEKRNFRLYAKRNQDTDDMLFIQLFDLLDKQDEIEESIIFKKIPGIQKAQFSNVKRHLYTQILSSLRLLHAQKSLSLKVREHLDYAEILYGKGLFLQSLKILGKAKHIAEKIHDDLLMLSIIEFEKVIESRHITRSGVDKSEILVREAAKRNQLLSNAIRLSNLRILLHGHYIKSGHVKDEQERLRLEAYFEENRPNVPVEVLSVAEQIYLYQSYVWYYYIQLDWKQCYMNALKWVELFSEDEVLLSSDPDLYMRGYHYLLTAAYNLKDINAYGKHLDDFEDYRKVNYKTFNQNSQIISFLYVHMGRFNRHFLSGTFQEGLKEIPRTLKRIRKYGKMLDTHRIMVFYYKFSWMYLAAGKPDTAVDYLNKILQMEVENLREDLQGYARLMFLMAHYDLQNYHIMDYLIRSVKSFFERMHTKNKLQERTLSFFEKVSKAPLTERKLIMQEFYEAIQILQQDPFEKRAFLYLEINAWVKSKILKVTISEALLDQ